MGNKLLSMMISVVIGLLILFGLTKSVYAPPMGGCCTIRSSHLNAFPVVIVPPPPTWATEGFTHYWSPIDVVKAFDEKKLEVIRPKVIRDIEQYGFGAATKELMRFSIPSIGENIQGCVLSFEIRANLEKVKRYYLDLNKSGKLYTWSFVKDNILFVTDGVVPESKAREYERVLAGLKK